MKVVLIAVVTAVLASAPVAHAEPTSEPQIFGYLTSDEKQEIWENGWRNCVALDEIADYRPVISDDVDAVIKGHVADGWDLESAADVVWESVEGRCSIYMPAVERAVRAYGPAT